MYQKSRECCFESDPSQVAALHWIQTGIQIVTEITKPTLKPIPLLVILVQD